MLQQSVAKFVFVHLGIRDGERQYDSKMVQEVAGNITPEKAADMQARCFRFESPVEENNAYLFDGGEVAVFVNEAREISREEYDVLKSFLQ